MKGEGHNIGNKDTVHRRATDIDVIIGSIEECTKKHFRFISSIDYFHSVLLLQRNYVVTSIAYSCVVVDYCIRIS